jgi:hypothetical protein
MHQMFKTARNSQKLGLGFMGAVTIMAILTSSHHPITALAGPFDHDRFDFNKPGGTTGNITLPGDFTSLKLNTTVQSNLRGSEGGAPRFNGTNHNTPGTIILNPSSLKNAQNKDAAIQDPEGLMGGPSQ